MANQLIIKEFDPANEHGAIDGVVSHIYSTAPDKIDSRYFNFQIIEKTWGKIFGGLTNYVTEWKLRSNTSILDKHEDYDLKQAYELVNMAESFVKTMLKLPIFRPPSTRAQPICRGTRGRLNYLFQERCFACLPKIRPAPVGGFDRWL